MKIQLNFVFFKKKKKKNKKKKKKKIHHARRALAADLDRERAPRATGPADRLEFKGNLGHAAHSALVGIASIVGQARVNREHAALVLAGLEHRQIVRSEPGRRAPRCAGGHPLQNGIRFFVGRCAINIYLF
jgi:hypothetical protein